MKLRLWFGWTAVTFFYCYQYVLRVVPSVLMEDITRKFSLTPQLFGQFSGIYYFGYSVAHLPVGILLDRYGPKKVVPICILLTTVGMLPLLFDGIWVFPVLGRLVMGIGSSAAALGLFKVIQITFDRAKFSRILSASVTVGLIGAIYGGGPVHMINEAFGFETVVLGISALGIALAGFAYALLPSYSENSRASIQHLLLTVIKNRRFMLLCGLAGMMVAPLEGFADVWGAQFLKVVYGLDPKVASSLPSFIFMGMCFGGPFLCYLAERFKLHFETMLFSAVGMAGSFSYVLLSRPSSLTLTVIFLFVGVLCTYQILMIDTVSKLVPKEATGLATAIANMIIMSFGYLFHSVIGKVVGASGKFDDVDALTQGVSVIPFSLICASFLLFFTYLSDRRTQRHAHSLSIK